MFSILPAIDHFFPTAVARGNGDDQDDSNLWSFVNIYGSGMNGVTGVKFSGVGHFTGASRWDDGRLCAHVPPNATSGKVVVESGPDRHGDEHDQPHDRPSAEDQLDLPDLRTDRDGRHGLRLESQPRDGGEDRLRQRDARARPRRVGHAGEAEGGRGRRPRPDRRAEHRRVERAVEPDVHRDRERAVRGVGFRPWAIVGATTDRAVRCRGACSRGRRSTPGASPASSGSRRSRRPAWSAAWRCLARRGRSTPARSSVRRAPRRC